MSLVVSLQISGKLLSGELHNKENSVFRILPNSLRRLFKTTATSNDLDNPLARILIENRYQGLYGEFVCLDNPITVATPRYCFPVVADSSKHFQLKVSTAGLF